MNQETKYSKDNPSAPVEVCAAVIRQGSRTLICGRAKTSPLYGYWEFPGGKVEKGETFAQCIQREIWEELGMKILPLDTVWVLEHCYPDKKVRVRFIRCIPAPDSPPPQARDQQDFKWIESGKLNQERMLPADTPFAEFLVKSEKIRISCNK